MISEGAMTTDEQNLRDAIMELRLAMGTIKSAVETLTAAVTTLQSTMVTKEGLATLEARVGNVEKGVERNDDKWAKVAWFIGFAVATALLGLVLNGGLP